MFSEFGKQTLPTFPPQKLLPATLSPLAAACLQNGEDEVSYILFWQYAASLATLPACLALYLELLQRGVLTQLQL